MDECEVFYTYCKDGCCHNDEVHCCNMPCKYAGSFCKPNPDDVNILQRGEFWIVIVITVMVFGGVCLIKKRCQFCIRDTCDRIRSSCSYEDCDNTGINTTVLFLCGFLIRLCGERNESSTTDNDEIAEEKISLNVTSVVVQTAPAAPVQQTHISICKGYSHTSSTDAKNDVKKPLSDVSNAIPTREVPLTDADEHRPYYEEETKNLNL